jgi:uncharacterized protein YqgV (UPF0045/DUF77 family)
MNISIDLSLYPLKEEFEPKIIAFIESLRKSSFKIIENPLSTQVYGPFDEVVSFVFSEIKKVFDEEPHAVFAIKIVNGDRS